MTNSKGFNEIKNAKPMELKLDKFESYQERLKRREKELEKKYEFEKQEKAKNKLKEDKEPTKIKVIQRATRERDRGMER